MSRPQLVRPNTAEILEGPPRATNFSRPIAPARSQSTSHDLLNPPNFDLTSDLPKPAEQRSESKYRYVPHVRISEDDDDRPRYRPHLRLEDDEEQEEDEADESADEAIGIADASDPSSAASPPASSSERATSAESSTSPSSASEKSATLLNPPKSRPPAFASDSFISISSASSAAPKPLNIRPPISKYARASEPRLETIPSASPPSRNSSITPLNAQEADVDSAPSPGVPVRRRPPLELPDADPGADAGADAEPDCAVPPSIPSHHRPHIVKRVSFDQHSEHTSPKLHATIGATAPVPFPLSPSDNDAAAAPPDSQFGVSARVSHDLEFDPGTFPDPFDDAASRISIDTEAQEPFDAPDLPATTATPRPGSVALPYRPSNSSSRGSARASRSSSEASSSAWSGASGRHPVESLSEKEIAKLKKKGINPELFAEMREARRKAHGKRARLVGPLVGSTFVG
ncbi:MAG: hypothetical protein M1821_005901 [Bathelium mastoideum]|nr:MAG: hypothetical protein M1821_005901 [Bathelium mastoideum]KAI9688562.1 MAG: hypothetical protein M1822_001511 [Bathelium mastoideum]